MNLTSSPGDVARFYRELLAGRVLSPLLLRAMKRLVPTLYGTGYGLGIERTPEWCGDTWGHTGRVPGFASF